MLGEVRIPSGKTSRTRMEQHRQAWLDSGRTILTLTERSARAIRSCYDEQQKLSGCLAWTSPSIHSWDTWLHMLWQQIALDTPSSEVSSPLRSAVLTTAQELVLWSSAIASQQSNAVVGGSLREASLAMQAHSLLCSHCPELLAPGRRQGWSGDACIFSQWLQLFQQRCRLEQCISVSQLPMLLAERLEQNPGFRQPALLLVGFDRLLPAQRRLLDAFGDWQLEAIPSAPPSIHYQEYPDAESEIAACFRWIAAQVAQQPQGRWIILAPRADELRGPLERGQSQLLQSGQEPLVVEFTHGLPLASQPMVRAAMQMLRWGNEPVTETELLWLLTTGCFTENKTEQTQLLGIFDRLQSGEMARTEWSQESFCRAAEKYGAASWSLRLRNAQQTLAPEQQTVDDWCTCVSDYLAESLWIDATALDSTAYQAHRQFHAVLDSCASVRAVSAATVTLPQFLRLLQHLLDEKSFSTEAQAPQIQISTPAESAGLVADGIWFLGADSSQWPSTGKPNPLLPLAVQVEAQMPHASLELDIAHSDATLQRIARMSGELRFSYSPLHQDGGRFPSAPVLALAGHLHSSADASFTTDPSAYLHAAGQATAAAIPANADAAPHMSIDDSRAAHGGSSLLTHQSLCPFRAFAAHRLRMDPPQAAEPGISASLRGRLLHAALSGIWGEHGGLRTLEDLQNCIQSATPMPLDQLVERHVDRALAGSPDALQSETISPTLVALERQRMIKLLQLWLHYEASRHAFTVHGCEITEEVVIAGLRLSIRVDRQDRVGDRLLILDYKTSEHGPKSWLGDRPDDVQLPLYALHPPAEDLEGLVFANLVIAEDKRRFQGLVRNATETLLPNIQGIASLVKHPLTQEQLDAWRTTLTALAQEFLRGEAAVRPKKFPDTCKHCGMQALCRVPELMLAEVNDESGENADEL